MAHVSGEPKGKKRLSRVESKARTRDQLLESASQVFIQKGFAGASVEEIAESAGYSIGALYSNFASKEQLFIDLMTARRASRLAAMPETMLTNHRDSRLTFDDLPAMLVEMSERVSDFAALQVEFWQFANSHPELRSVLVHQMREHADVLERLITRCMDNEGIASPPSARDITDVVLALMQGLVRRRRIELASVDDKLFTDALDWLFVGVRASAPARENA